MLHVPNNPSFGYVTGNTLTTRPAAVMGTSITPGLSNSYGSYTEILSDANVTRDCYGMMLNFNSGSFATEPRDQLVTIGIDTAGGTSYVNFIPHLIAACASAYGEGTGGHWYYFPIYVPAGSAIAAKAQVNHGSNARSLSCQIWLYGAPKNISGLVYGHGVEALGVDTATSAGTAITAGAASEGTWTSLGTTTKKWKFAQFGVGVNDGTMGSAAMHHADLAHGDASNKYIIDQDKRYSSPNASEQWGGQLRSHTYVDLPIGATIYGRDQGSGTGEAGLSMAAYGVY